jgi:hypothetical protein
LVRNSAAPLLAIDGLEVTIRHIKHDPRLNADYERTHPQPPNFGTILFDPFLNASAGFGILLGCIQTAPRTLENAAIFEF